MLHTYCCRVKRKIASAGRSIAPGRFLNVGDQWQGMINENNITTTTTIVPKVAKEQTLGTDLKGHVCQNLPGPAISGLLVG